LNGTASHIEKLVRQYQRVERLNQEDHDRVQRESRRFSCYYDDDGMLEIKGRLAPEDGAVFLKALEAVMDRMPGSQGHDAGTGYQENVSAESV
jgi:hypothetical protein